MHMRNKGTTRKILQISTRYTQLELGTSQPFWNRNFSKCSTYITSTWTTHIWDYLYTCGIRLMDNEHWVYDKPRDNDFHLMDVILESGLSEFQIKVITVGDIYDEKRNAFKPNVIDCNTPMESTFGWPHIKAFPRQWKNIWVSILANYILPRVRLNPLGEWRCQSHLIGEPIIPTIPPVTPSHNVNTTISDYAITSQKNWT